MAKIFVTRMIPAVGLKMLKAAGHRVTVWAPDRVIPRKELLKRIRGCEAVLTMLTEKVDGEFLTAAGPGLKIVANMAVGYDNFDLAELTRHGVVATNTPSVLNGAVSEHTFALLMTVAKRIPETERFLRAGKYKGWSPTLLLGTELKDKMLGVIGLGRIGAGVVKRARAMDMRVIYHDMKRDEAFEKEYGAVFGSLEDVLRQADFLSLHVPLLPSTRHLIDAKRLGLMKRTAYLINTARGPIVDEKALVAALKRKRIAGAALDVFEFEPRLTPGLTRLDNVVITPHTASATIETRDAMAATAAQGILDVLSGKPPKNVIP